MKKLVIIASEKPNFCKYEWVVCSFAAKIFDSDFFFKYRFSFKILNLSRSVPIPEKRVENNKLGDLSGSPIILCPLEEKIEALTKV